MYCSEKCRNTDWSTVQQNTCYFKEYNDPTTEQEFLKLDETRKVGEKARGHAEITMLIRLIACVGLENIKQTALENKPMKSLSGKPRTRGIPRWKISDS
jgi:hypothetical protein